jgi:transposase-like protein
VPALRAIYRAKDADAGMKALEAFEAGDWGQRYPAIALSWRRNWEHVIPFFAFPESVRRIIYTTNAIEALNSKLRRAVRTRGHFPSDDPAERDEAAISRPEPCGRGMETAAARVVRGQDAIRRRLRRAVRPQPSQ